MCMCMVYICTYIVNVYGTLRCVHCKCVWYTYVCILYVWMVYLCMYIVCVCACFWICLQRPEVHSKYLPPLFSTLIKTSFLHLLISLLFACAYAHMWKLEGNLWEMILFFHHVDSRISELRLSGVQTNACNHWDIMLALHPLLLFEFFFFFWKRVSQQSWRSPVLDRLTVWRHTPDLPVFTSLALERVPTAALSFLCESLWTEFRFPGLHNKASH